MAQRRKSPPGELSSRGEPLLRPFRRVSEGDIAHLERAAVQRFRANQATVSKSFVGVAGIGRATLQESTAGIVVARSLAADEVRAGILIAPVVRGEVHTWLDLRTAFAIGLGMALGRALLGGGRGRGR